MAIKTNVSNVVSYQWAFWDIADSSDLTFDHSGTPAGGPGFSVWVGAGWHVNRGQSLSGRTEVSDGGHRCSGQGGGP